jgi:glycogen debranching enzyme
MLNESEKSLIQSVALSSLLKNIVKTQSGRFVRAGPYQFGSIWTRDFCFAARGLLSVDPEVVIEHLDFLISKVYRGPEEGFLVRGLVARIIETQSSKTRVLSGLVRRRLGLPGFRKNIKDLCCGSI